MSVTVEGRVRLVLEAEAKAIRSVLVGPEYEDAVEMVLGATGKVVTTGMGKAGLVARKIAATLCSTGTPAPFLHPGEAAHGDLGLIAPGDLLIAFSNSGRTREVIECIEAARALVDVPLIVVTSVPWSPLAGAAEVVLDMGCKSEACPLGLAPSSSSAVMLAIGHAVALATMERRGFTREDFGRRHHGGYLGHQTRSEP